MDRIQILDAIERYLRNEMTGEERTEFEELRASNAEVDQLLVEHSLFLNELDKYGDLKHFRNSLNDVHKNLVAKGAIREVASGAMIRQLWKRHKRVMGVAASIAGITTLIVAGMLGYYSRKASTEVLQQLSKKFENTEKKVNALKQQVESDKALPKSPATPIKSGGTGFLIDIRGFIVTNAHVIENANTVVLQNNKGQEFRAGIVHVNPENDIAILKIDDSDFVSPHPYLPYSFKKNGAELGEQVFTLGYPREEIVYNEGYMSARTGFNGDTLSCQIGVSANPGNSGGPVFNRNGEVIGIINTRQTQAEGVVFALNSENIFNSVDSIGRVDSMAKNIRLPVSSPIKGMDRVQQIRRISDYIYMVKGY